MCTPDCEPRQLSVDQLVEIVEVAAVLELLPFGVTADACERHLPVAWVVDLLRRRPGSAAADTIQLRCADGGMAAIPTSAIGATSTLRVAPTGVSVGVPGWTDGEVAIDALSLVSFEQIVRAA